MSRIAIIPARSGSKGLQNKNILPFNGKPLLAHSVEAALKSGLFDVVHVSTDSEEYAAIAREYGADVPFFRSKELSLDTSSSWDTVIEVLENYKKLGLTFDTVCLLQPTSPLRNYLDIVDAYDFMDKMSADAVTSVCETDHSPLWTTLLDSTYSLREYRKRSKQVPRQKLAKYYRINGAIYIRRICYASVINLVSDNEVAFVMPRERSVDIDTKLDFIISEILANTLSEKKWDI